MSGWIGVELNTLEVSQTELAWAAGFFDGEGSTFVNHQTAKRYDRGPDAPSYEVNSPVCSISQVQLEPLARFATIVQGRTPTGPYKSRTPNSSPYYRWDACGRPSVHRVLSMLWPYLSGPKKEQARRAWAELERLHKPRSPELPPLPVDVIGVDFDGTLAHYDGWQGETVFGEPIPAMVERVKGWLAAGYEVRLVTARAFGSDGNLQIGVTTALYDWMEKHLGVVLTITASKDLSMIELWDDRCVQVVQNTGEPVSGQVTRTEGPPL